MLTRAHDLLVPFFCIIFAGNFAILAYETMAYLLEWENYFDRKQAFWTFFGVSFGLTYLSEGTSKIAIMQEQAERNSMFMRAFDLFALFLGIIIVGNLAILVYETMAYLLGWESHFDWKQALWIVFSLGVGFDFLCEAIVKIAEMQKQTEKNARLIIASNLFIDFLGWILMGSWAILAYEAMAYFLEWESHFDWRQVAAISVGVWWLGQIIGNKVSLMEQKQKRKSAT